MCTAATYKTKDFYMGRTLDYEFSYGEQITITPRNYEFDFRFAGKIKSHYALIGMAFVAEGYPLYYDDVNGSLPISELRRRKPDISRKRLNHSDLDHYLSPS